MRSNLLKLSLTASKKWAFCLLFLFFFSLTGLQAQNNLQWNRAVLELITGPIEVNRSSYTKTITVPASKVWKIENVSYSINITATSVKQQTVSVRFTGASGCQSNTRDIELWPKMYIGNIYVGFISSLNQVGDFIQTSSYPQTAPSNYICWLPAGTYQVQIPIKSIQSNIGSCHNAATIQTPGTFNATINAIEFNLVP